MGRLPAGIQLGKGVRPGFLRALEVLVLGGFLMSLWGGASLWRTRADLAAAGVSGSGDPTPAVRAGSAALEPGHARQAAALLFAGVLDAPAVSAALDTVRGTAPPGIRVAGVEVRPAAGAGRVEAVIAADAVSAAAVAGFLVELANHDAVLSTEVISETRRPDGAAVVRITAQLAVGR
ncbi:MAG: hypothetical protein OXP70_04645 [Acidobacteriota bacterium]|nr:hypothetical protein [Acidobacteriota bacterium]